MIELKNVTVTYKIIHDGSHSLKEKLINFFHRRKYVDMKVESFNALDGLSFRVGAKERLGVIGRNGAGKSTLLKTISGILKPTKGSVYVDGMIQPLIEIAAGFNPEFTGRENIYLNGYMLGFTPKQIKNKEDEIIRFSELEKFIDMPAKYFSSGMSVRLAFAIATSIEPDILLFDEMLSAGDAEFVKKAKSRLDELVSKANGVVVVSHDLDLIRSFATRAIVLDKGRVVFDGPPAEAVNFYLDLGS